MATGVIKSPGAAITLTTADNAKLISLGTTPDPFEGGGIALDLVPDGSWSGSITIEARGMNPDNINADPVFVAFPYRVYSAGGTAGTGTLTVGTTTLTGRSLVTIPSAGFEVAVLVACSAGTALLSWRQLRGTLVP